MKPIVLFEFGLRTLSALLGYIFILLCIKFKGGLQEYIMWLPIASCASIVFDFGRVELASKNGLSSTQITRNSKELRLLILLFFVLLQMVSVYEVAERNIAIFIALFGIGLSLIPLDCLIRAAIYSQKSVLRLYVFQISWITINLILLSLYRNEVVTFDRFLQLILIAPWIIYELFIIFRIFKPEGNEDSLFAPDINLQERLLSLSYKVMPIVLYSVGLYIAQRSQVNNITQIFNRCMFFFFGFFQGRILTRQSNLSSGIAGLFAIITVGSFLTSIPMIVIDNPGFLSQFDLSMSLFLTFFIAFMSILYAFFLKKYAHFILEHRSK